MVGGVQSPAELTKHVGIRLRIKQRSGFFYMDLRRPAGCRDGDSEIPRSYDVSLGIVHGLPEGYCVQQKNSVRDMASRPLGIGSIPMCMFR